jgi:CheY-like chemotaxis protein
VLAELSPDTASIGLMDRADSMARGGPPGGQPAAVPQRAPLAAHRLLVVDDERDVADSMGRVLRLLGAEVRVAYDGVSALALCEGWRPTDVLSDLGMPGMDGYELACRLRERLAGEPLRLIAMSGWMQERVRAKAIAAGFDIFLPKPVGLQDLQGACAL